jgi:hypothetical protein
MVPFLLDISAKAEDNSDTAVLILWYIVHKYYLSKGCTFLQDLLLYIMSGP